MTRIIGLTGGIGSGKSTVASYIASKGIPVYIADEEAKKLMNSKKVDLKISSYPTEGARGLNPLSLFLIISQRQDQHIGNWLTTFGVGDLAGNRTNRTKVSA